MLGFKYHSRSLFVNPRVIIWNETAISCYSDLAPAIPAGRGLRGSERKRERERAASLNSNEGET